MKIMWPILLSIVCTPALSLHAQESNSAVETFLDKTLPAYEKAAAECIEELNKQRDSADPKVVAAVNGARFRADLFLQSRAHLLRDPKYLRYLTSANLKLWQEGMDHFRDCARQAKD